MNSTNNNMSTNTLLLGIRDGSFHLGLWFAKTLIVLILFSLLPISNLNFSLSLPNAIKHIINSETVFIFIFSISFLIDFSPFPLLGGNLLAFKLFHLESLNLISNRLIRADHVDVVNDWLDVLDLEVRGVQTDQTLVFLFDFQSKDNSLMLQVNL